MIDTKNINKENYYSVSEVARMLDYKTNQSVYNLIKEGKLKASKNDKNIIILGQDILDYLSVEEKIIQTSINSQFFAPEGPPPFTKEFASYWANHPMTYKRRLEILEANYQAGIYEKDYYEYVKEQLIENMENPPRCPYCESILDSNSVFNREFNDTYHICKQCESILTKFLNRPRTVNNADIILEKQKIDGKLYYTLTGFANNFRVSMINLHKQVLPYRLQKIEEAIKNEKIKTIKVGDRVFIPAEELYRILDLCKNNNLTFDSLFLDKNYSTIGRLPQPHYELHQAAREAGMELNIENEEEAKGFANELELIYPYNVDDFIEKVRNLYTSINIPFPAIFEQLSFITDEREQQNIIGAFLMGLYSKKKE